MTGANTNRTAVLHRFTVYGVAQFQPSENGRRLIGEPFVRNLYRVTISMAGGLGKDIHDGHAGDNEGYAGNGENIESLFEDQPANQGDKGNTHSRPDGIGNTERDGAEGE